MPNLSDIDAGDLDRRVQLLAPVYADEFEDEIVGWQVMATVWAGIRPAAQDEVNEAGRVVSRVSVPVVIRYRSDIDARWRIQDRDQIYQVRSVADAGRQQTRLDIQCEQIL
jgi:SPP1 family predicted phage head-tail adaptor